MSSPTTYGLTTVTFGNPTMTGFVVESTAISSKCGVAAQVFNETGELVHERYDDVYNELSLEMIVTTGSIPAPGTEITFNSIKYIVTTADVKTASKDFTKLSVKAHNSANITLS